jgi:glycolate oxidase subunit GlcD
VVIARELRSVLDAGAVLDPPPAAYLADATEGRGLRGRADAVVLPRDAAEVAAVVAWCCAHDVAMVPRGGGTGFAAGAVPLDGGVVISLERLTGVRAFDPQLWRMHVEAGVRTADVRRRARESGLLFPPDPGAAESSQIGANIATNAGGPHAFKYGVTGAWVTGVEAVVAPGDVIAVGGPVRKDVAGYDLKSLMIGSEGTLGIVTAAWLRLLPAPEAALPVVALYPGTAAGCAGIERVLAAGLVPSALEYLDSASIAAAAAASPLHLPAGAGFMVIAEADGSPTEAARVRDDLVEVLGGGALAVHLPETRREAEALWRWRDGVSLAVTAQMGGKVSEDIVVPLDRLEEAIEETLEIGARHDLPACSWGHAGDGNLHSTFMVAADDHAGLGRAAAAAEELFGLAVQLGGSVSGEHGVGWVKRHALARQWPPRALDLHAQVKRAFDPQGLMNPGKKPARG